jgi:signal transduction histidine kinase
VVVYLREDENNHLAPKAPNIKTSNFPTFSFEDISPVLESARPIVVSPVSIEPYIIEGAFAQRPATDIILAPFIAGKETIGMLLLVPHYNALTETLLDDDTERLLGTLVNQAAVAIKNAQLFRATQLAYEELRQLDDLKTKFINIAAHELRTPLGAMLGYASFVQKRVPATLTNATRFLVASTLRMRTMVDAMLAIQRLDAGKSFLRLNTVDVRSIIKKSVVDFKPIADLEKHTLTANLPDKLPPVQADAEKIGLILSNLLSNAIKFTPEGGKIVVSAKDYLKGVLVSVRDSGVGIAPEDQKRIFERFYQARPDHLAGHGGIGIGLFIVKHMVELHQGQIWVESEVDKGTTFFFTLPEIESEETNGSSSAQDTPLPKTRPEKTPQLEMT